MAILIVAQSAQGKLSINFIFYYEFYKILDISFNTKILQFRLRRISSVKHHLRHVIAIQYSYDHVFLELLTEILPNGSIERLLLIILIKSSKICISFNYIYLF